MRKLLWLVCAVTFTGLPALAQPAAGGPAGAAQQNQPPEHPVTLDQVHEMMQLTGAGNLARQMMEKLMPLMRQSMPPYMPSDVLDDIQSSMLHADLETPIIHVYQQHLSTDDGAAIIAFYKTPAGQRFLATMPAIVQESQQAGGQVGRQIIDDVLTRHQPEIEAAKKKYDQEHPGEAPQS